jgi:hypothetical protein
MDWSDVTITLHKAPLPACSNELTNVDWLSVAPASGSIPQGDNENVSVMVNSTGLIPGEHIGYLCVHTNDPNAEQVIIPVTLEVVGSGPASLHIADQPSGNNVVNTALQPALVVEVLDAGGNVSTTDNYTVLTITLDVHASGAVLGGTLSATVVNGVATFDNLTLDQPGTGFMLIVEDDQGKLGAELTSPFNILGDDIFLDRFEQSDAP